MSLPNYLAKIKSSGIYRFVWDKSEIAGVPANVLRLVVGYSEKGPFNTPVYITKDTEFKAIFGDISKKLEKRGIWFHRLALQALSKGPIIALNLKKFSDEKVRAYSFAVDEKTAITPIEIPVETIYDTSRFWKLDPEAILKATAKEDQRSDKYISITAADSKETSCSVFIRGYKPNGYDVTVKEWFATLGEEVPDYFVSGDYDYSSLLVSDFFAQVYVFKGEFTPALCATAPLNTYFDIVGGKPQLKEYIVNGFGDKIDTLDALAADEASNFVNVYSGCLLPFFKSQTNSYISLDLLFNADNGVHKMMMNLNSDLLYNGDITVNTLVTTGWLSNYAFGAQLKQTKQVFSSDTATKVEVEGKLISTEYAYKYGAEDGKEATAHPYDLIEYKGSVNAGDKEILKYIGGVEYKYLPDVKANILGSEVEAIVYAAKDPSALYLDYERIALYNDQTWVLHTGDEEYALPVDPFEIQDLETLEVTDVVEEEEVKKYYRYEFTEGGGLYRAYHSVTGNEDVYVKGSGVDAKLYKKISNQYVLFDKAIKIIPGSVNGFDLLSVGLVVGDRLIITVDGKQKFVVITALDKDFAKTADAAGNEYLVTRKDDFLKCNHSASISSYQLKPIYFEGYTYLNAAPASSRDWDKLQWQKTILSTLIDYEGLRTGLTSRTDIDYRYIVDTFEAYVDSEVHKELALICKEKENAVGFLNFPNAKTFKNCDYACFTDDKGRFQVKYIAEGANKQKNPGILFSLVSENNGASFVSYNTPLLFTDGTVKTYVPAAALVSNNFMDKYEGRQPYYVVAGPTYGRLTYTGLVGPDFNYTRADLDILEPLGVNVTVFVPRLGTYINSNQTAKQTPKTALSSMNVRELVIYLQDEIEKLLQDYQWEFNTPYLRDLVKAKADTICERVKNNHGIQEYLNVCDESNNTPDVIDNEMFVLSTSIEPGRTSGKMVQELTIYKTGALKALIK